MRVLQITPAFYPAKGYGGGPRVAYEISKRLCDRGHEVIVYTTDANDKYSRLDKKFKNIDEMKIYYFKNISNSIAYEQKIFISPSIISAMKKDLKNFDIIHVHDFRTLQNIVVHHYAKKFRVPYILQPHGSLSRIVKKRALKSVFDTLFGYRILKDANKLIALNNNEAKKYVEMKMDKDKIETIPNGIDLLEYSNLPCRGSFKEKYHIQEGEEIILYLGRIHESKGIDLLVKAFAELLKKLDDVKLIIVGPNDGYLLNLKEIINSLKIDNNILFTGFISDKEKLSAYIDADVFVMPSFYGFPLTLLEAMACGVPIVTTNKGDIIEGINGETGCIVQYDKSELENALFEILENGELGERFRKNAKEKIKQYDWEAIVDKIEKIYQETQDLSRSMHT